MNEPGARPIAPLPEDRSAAKTAGEMLRAPRKPPPRPTYVNGQARYRSTGRDQRAWTDVYHWILRTGWAVLLLCGSALYVVLNALFALAYLLQDGSVTGLAAGDFVGHFFFSVQTLSTIGYGGYAPATTYANVLVTVEAFAGLAFTALSTGVVFAKFSRPEARILFSDVLVVHDRDGVPHLSMRLSNQRHNHIVEAKITLTVLLDERTEEGQAMRRLYDLALVRSSTPMFGISWTVLHPILPGSPLCGVGPANVARDLVSVIVVFSGVDDTYAQPVHARRVYRSDSIVFGKRFVDMLLEDPEGGGLLVDVARLSTTLDAPWSGVRVQGSRPPVP